eukprot:scaffold80916_cov41-Prasinocladus_malaysianus.AAC.1
MQSSRKLLCLAVAGKGCRLLYRSNNDGTQSHERNARCEARLAADRNDSSLRSKGEDSPGECDVRHDCWRISSRSHKGLGNRCKRN